MLLFIASVLAAWYLHSPEMWNKQAMFLVERAAPIANPESSLSIPVSSADPQQHAFEFSNNRACIAPPTKAISTAPRVRSYSWMEEGRMHFGDSPPSHVTATPTVFSEPNTLEYFQLEINFQGKQTVPFLQDRLTSSTSAIYKILASLLGTERLRQVELNISIFATRDDYQNYARSISGERIANASGFYTPRTNEAVTYRHNSHEATLNVSRHEAVHVIVNGLMGRAPTWFNEGLADYFERIEVSGQISQIAVNENSLQRARLSIANGYPQQLSDYLSLSAEEWYSGPLDTHYALGWSVIYYLMESPEGRKVIASLMQELADNYCTPVDSLALLTQTYPGGIQGLEQNYYQWLFDTEPKATHRY